MTQIINLKKLIFFSLITIFTAFLIVFSNSLQYPFDFSENDENFSENEINYTIETNSLDINNNTNLNTDLEISNVVNDITRSPLDQFEIKDYAFLYALLFGNILFSLTNIGLYLSISSLIILLLVLLVNYQNLPSDKWGTGQEAKYATVFSIVINQINKKKGQIFFVFIYTLFIFILINNLVGMIPYSFASTSHFVLTFFLSFSIVLGSTILGLYIYNFKFFSLFVPENCPLGLLPLLVLIEFISYLARNVSLGLRLAANILSGHMLLNILSDFTYKIMTSSIAFFFLGLIPLTFIMAFSGLELAISFIQAQVFVVLSSSYINNGLNLH